MRKIAWSLVALFSLIVSACSAGPAANPSKTEGAAGQPRAPRTLIHLTRNEPDSISQTGAAGTDNDFTRYLNAAFTVIDQNGEFVPQLAESLPQINTATWTVA